MHGSRPSRARAHGATPALFLLAAIALAVPAWIGRTTFAEPQPRPATETLFRDDADRIAPRDLVDGVGRRLESLLEPAPLPPADDGPMIGRNGPAPDVSAPVLPRTFDPAAGAH